MQSEERTKDFNERAAVWTEPVCSQEVKEKEPSTREKELVEEPRKKLILKKAQISHSKDLQQVTNREVVTKKDLVCDCCGARFGVKKRLREHMRYHFTPSFACPKCDKKLLREYYLNRHLKRHASVTEVCKYCNKGFSNKDSLRRHIIVETFRQVSL